MDGKHFIDGLYKVTLSHDGNTATGDDVYYKMGETIKTGAGTGELQGSYYALSGKGNSSTDVDEFFSTKDVVMSEALKNKTIYDKYYHIQAVAKLGDASDPAINEFVLGGGDSSALGTATNIKSLYAKSSDGSYVVLNSDAKIPSVAADYDIVDAGYARVEEAVNVAASGSADITTDGMVVRASVAKDTYVKVGTAGQVVTINLELLPNGKTAAKGITVDVSACETDGSKAIVAPDADFSIVAKDTSVLAMRSFTITLAADSQATSGEITVTLTLIDTPAVP